MNTTRKSIKILLILAGLIAISGVLRYSWVPVIPIVIGTIWNSQKTGFRTRTELAAEARSLGIVIREENRIDFL